MKHRRDRRRRLFETSCELLETRWLLAGSGGLDWSTFLGGAGADGILDVAAVPGGSGDVIVRTS